MHILSTIGYESATMPDFLEALTEGGVQLVADIRAVAGSRRPGFSKTRLAGHLLENGIDYVHLRGLGTPADGRAAARSGNYAELERIYQEHLATAAARTDLDGLIQLIESGRRVCLLCYEADPAHCHRSLVAAAVASRVPIELQHLYAVSED
ncbi:MAG TPA: DUF488 domain-containing protein [Longimicrobiales bacterium]